MFENNTQKSTKVSLATHVVPTFWRDPRSLNNYQKSFPTTIDSFQLHKRQMLVDQAIGSRSSIFRQTNKVSTEKSSIPHLGTSAC